MYHVGVTTIAEASETQFAVVCSRETKIMGKAALLIRYGDV